MEKSERYLYGQEEFLTQLVHNGSNLYGYLIQKRRGILPKEVVRQHGVPSAIDNLPDWVLEQGYVAARSVEHWKGLFQAIHRGEKSGSAMVTMRTAGGAHGTFWLRFDTVPDQQGQPLFAFITLDDFTSISQQVRLQVNDINGLLQATRKAFPEILTLNLTQGTYRMIQYDSATTLGTPKEGLISDMVRIRLSGVAPEDRDGFVNTFSCARLEEAFLRDGKESVQLVYRRPGAEGKVYWFETTVMQQSNPFNSDVLLVAMSRSVDAQKAEEARLRAQLKLQAEELRLTMSQMGKTLVYYDVPTSTLTVPPSYAKRKKLPQVIPGFPECIEGLNDEVFLPETLAAFQAFYDAIRRGEPTGVCEARLVDPGGAERWERLAFASIFDDEGRPLRAVISAENVTVSHAQAEENLRLKENERILHLIAQHTDRTILHYDIKAQTVRFWDDEADGFHLQEQPISAFFRLDDLPRDGRKKIESLFQDILDGVPSGADKILVKNQKGERRWLDLKYSTLPDGDGAPSAALLSILDITTQYEHEMAYRRYVQSVEFDKAKHLLFIESDLTDNLIERVDGQLLSAVEYNTKLSHSAFGSQLLDQVFLYENRAEASQYFSRENLLWMYAQGERHMKSEWKVRFTNGSLRWLDTEVALMSDPYNDHIKGFFRMMDITEEKEELLDIQKRSERDGMTGLLNRATAEGQIRQKMADRERPGILILLDLDDLKGINDTFGHEEGDRAIRGIAETLKAHFRESDIIGRIGGDEFIVYLPGAAENGGAIAVSVAALLRKLAGIPIGSNDERRTHCSVGCAVQDLEADTFETLYKQADLALYHVKRSGKNNFAFYSPDMVQADYQFQSQQLLSAQNTRRFELGELQHLLDAIAAFYPLVLSVNLSANDYYLMEAAGETFAQIPTFGTLDNFIQQAGELTHPSDVPVLTDLLSRRTLLQNYAQGEKNVRHYFRFRSGGQYCWMEATVIFYVNEHGDVCDFTLVRWASERSYELEQLWLQKVLELAVISSFEYICLLNVDSGEYFLYGNEENSHGAPKQGDFDAVTREIRDRAILPEEREAYYESAKLSTVVARMQADGAYSYRYSMPDGPRDAAFYWFEPTHSQLLMTVQRR